MTKEDWIILRLLKGWVKANPRHASQHPDYVATVVYLSKKLGKRNLFAAIDQLHLSHK